MRERFQGKFNTLKRVTAGALLGVVALAGCSAVVANNEEVKPDTSISSQGSGQPETTLYVGDWYPEEEYDRLGDLLAGQDVDTIISFSEPAGSEEMPAPTISEGMKKMIGGLAADSEVIVAVGGYGTEETRQPMLDAFEAQSQHPQAFAERTTAMLKSVSEQLGRPVNGVDLDWEWPRTDQSAAFGGLLESLDKKLPEAKISVAVPAADNLAGIAGAIDKVAEHVDTVNVMTYDQNTPYSAPRGAGPVSSNIWARDALKAWQQRMAQAGSDAQVAVGLPNYGYLYSGASQAGDAFNGGRTVTLTEVDPSALTRQPDGSSAGTTEEGWVSAYTAADAKELIDSLPADVPTFAWQAQGLQEDYLQALTRR